MGSSESTARSEKDDFMLIRIDKKKEEEEKAMGGDVIKAVLAVAGIAIVSWGLSKLLSSSDHSVTISNNTSKKLMRAPGRSEEYIYRDEFEQDPADYFRNLRN